MTTKEEKQYEDDVRKALNSAEHMRGGSPNNVLWLIVQSLRWVGMVAYVSGVGANKKLDELLRRPTGGGGAPCDLAPIERQLATIAVDIQGIKERLEVIDPPQPKAKFIIMPIGPHVPRH